MTATPGSTGHSFAPLPTYKTGGTRLNPRRHATYQQLLDRVARNRDTTPCVQRADGLDWLDPRANNQRQAAQLCAGCPAMAACAAFIRGTPGVAGVWAGTTEQDRQGRASRYRGTRANRTSTADTGWAG